MNEQSILKHMNDHHKDDLKNVVKKFASAKTIESIELKGVDFNGLDIVYNNLENLRVDFPSPATEQTLKDAIIALCMSAKPIDSKGLDSIKNEIEAFRAEFGSVFLASIDKNGNPLATYAPLIQANNKCYIYISEVADHYESLKHNSNKLEVAFIEDECKAKSIILRKRLRYKSEAVFIKRGSKEFEEALNELESSMNGAGGVKIIREMIDFHLVELRFKNGRFVKGFGQAYDLLENGSIKHVGATSNPHKKADGSYINQN